jgi:hypothetical protein
MNGATQQTMPSALQLANPLKSLFLQLFPVFAFGLRFVSSLAYGRSN